MLKGNASAVETTPAIQSIDVTNSDFTLTGSEFTNGLSAFTEGRQFKLTGVKKLLYLNEEERTRLKEMKDEGKTDEDFLATLPPTKRVNVVFTTDIDDDTVIYLSSYHLRKTKLDVTGKPVRRDGAFDKAVYDLVDNVKQDDDLFELSQKLFKKFEGKTITVRRKLYTGLSYGRQQTLSIPCFDA